MTDIIPAISLGAFKATPTGLRVPRGRVSFDRWEELGAQLRLVQGAVQWAIGDWLNYGDDTFGEKAAQAWNIWPEYGYDQLGKFARVARSYPLSTRRRDISWSMHSELRKLPVNEREVWLDALEKGLTRADLRLSLDGREPVEKENCPTCGTLVDKGKIR